MSKTKKAAISPTREEDYPEWYQQVIKAADLAEHASTRGCMVIKPWGYAVWENIQRVLDQKIKETGHENASFPLLIPLGHLTKEAEHVEGFAKECAVVTHHRLKKNEKGELIPDGKLEEPYVVRPTSEMIIGESFAKWINSYRDLPLLINQWANVFRWEMRTRLFLRTAEFFWQEGHTAHATEKEAVEETERMHNVYADLCSDYLAIPAIKGVKSEGERFPGAVETYTLEAMMQDGKALQLGTSHYLGTNFSKALNIDFDNEEGKREYAHTTSWGVTTRLVGGLIMTHSDDDGLVLPPRVASKHIVLMPILIDDTRKKEVLDYTRKLASELSEIPYYGRQISVVVDDSDERGRNWKWVKKGIPLRIEIGPRDIDNDKLLVMVRNRSKAEAYTLSHSELIVSLREILDTLHNEALRSSLNV